MNTAVNQPMLDDLRRPQAYPAPHPSSVRLETTHISWVFLTDDDAWKLKRPVNYGFLDYTTPEKRRFYCQEEVRLNRRLAPDVYLGVVPVRKNGGYSFSMDGAIVDYAVRMRRLPDDVCAEAMLSRGTLTHAHLTRLAAVLARFYSRAREAAAFGSVDLARRNAAENFDQVRAFIGRFITPEQFSRAENLQTGFLDGRTAAFRERAGRGRIREGHGDLRLEHVYFEGEDPVVIDGIEFNERFRMLDTASDVAFTAMELEAHGRRDLAEWFLGRFAAESDDFDLYSVIDFYIAYRAWVRAKVACFLAADPATPPDKAARKAVEARELFALADGRPTAGAGGIIVVGGLPGCGKTTISDALARATGIPVVSSDRTRKFLAGVPVMERAPEEAYTAAFSRRTFDEFFRRAGIVAASGRSVILDATFRTRETRDRARRLASSLGRPFLFIEAACSEKVALERLRDRARGVSVSDANEAVFKKLRTDFEGLNDIADSELVTVDTSRPLDPQIADLVKRVLPAAPR